MGPADRSPKRVVTPPAPSHLGSKARITASAGMQPRVSGPSSSTEHAAPNPGDRPLVTVVCDTGSNVLEATHSFLTAYAASRVRSHVVQRLSVAAYELLANALNYGSLTGDVVVEFFHARSVATIRVSNDAIPARIQMLTDHAARVQENAANTFMEEMRRSVSGGIPHPMLGLVRLVHEAGLKLDVNVVDRRVVVSAGCSD
jgi:hypothetical protein